jgi:transposase-like protein
MKKSHKIAPDVREQIINRIKNEGVSVAEAAKGHGITESAIYHWLTKGVKGQPTILEVARLKRENQSLKLMLADATMALARAQKKI